MLDKLAKSQSSKTESLSQKYNNMAYFYGFASSNSAKCPYLEGTQNREEWFKGRKDGESASKSQVFLD